MLRQYNRFLTQADGRIYVVEVISVSGGISTVEGQSGEQFTVRGSGVAAGGNAIIQGGNIIAEAPSLPVISLTV